MAYDKKELERLVRERTAELETSNRELRRHIEDRTLHEDRLRRSEEAFRKLSREVQAILDAIPDNLTLQGPDHRLIWVNRGAARGLGMSLAALAGKHCYELWHGRQAPCESCPVTETLKSGAAAYKELTTPDGRVWELRTVPVKDEEGRTESVVEVGRDITEQKWVNDRLRTSLREKETLLKELNHRIKNNLQVVASLLNLQSGSVTDPEALAAIRETQDRVRSISLVHDKLYRSQDVSRINLGGYIEDLARSLLESYQSGADRVGLKLDMTETYVSPDTAIPCGLVLNELISNSLKYAFPDQRRGEISITLTVSGDGLIDLRVADNGIGFGPGFDFRKSQTLGLRLVAQLVEDQLMGTIDVSRAGGAGFVIRFAKQGNAREVAL